MKFNLKNWQKERKLTLFFTFLSLITIFAVVLTSYLVFKHYMDIVITNNTQNNEAFNETLSDILCDTYVNDKKTDDFRNFNIMTNRLLQVGTLKYAYIVNDNKITWSSDNNIINAQLSENDLKQTLLELEVGENTQEVKRQLSESEILDLVFSVGTKQSKEMDIIIIQIYLSFFLFVLFAIASSVFLGKILQKPLDKLTYGIKKFGAKDFTYRIPTTPFIELNQIVDSCNTMAFELNNLYNDLENKVTERTIELEKKNIELKEAQSMMVHSEKMRSLGELVAGIAHEINNPINFIYGNMVHFENYVKDIFELFDKYEELKSKVSSDDFKNIEDLKTDIDIEFIKTDIMDLIKSCRDGADRTKNIIADLKNFSRLDETTLTEFDIPKEIDTTLNILYNKYKNKIKIIKKYAENLPKIEAYGRQLNQVFMNVLDNAIYAIKEKGTITISAYLNNDNSTVSIEFEDTGVGIKEEDLKKVFDPFYTTKPVGEGTGLGMSIAYKVINSHSGSASVESNVGVGTKFRIILPINQKKEETV